MAAAAAAAAGAEAAPGAEPTGTASHFGAAFTLTDAVPLATAISTYNEAKGGTLKVTGTITSVCKKKGCWMVVKDGEVAARVTFKDYGFTVPIKSKGQAVVEGSLTVKTFTVAQAKHLAEDAGKDPATVTDELKEYVFTATGVQITQQ